MEPPYKPRVCERHFLNIPGHHAGAFVHAFVEDTSNRGLVPHRHMQAGVWNPAPRLILEMGDCQDRVAFQLEISDPAARQNTFHKLDTLIETLKMLRSGIAEECLLYRQRQNQLHDLIAEQAEQLARRP